MDTNVALLVEILAFMAGLLCTISFLPQVIKTWKERDARNISLGMYSVFISGMGFWFSVGFLLKSPSMMLWNGISILLALSVLFLKLRYSKFKGREKGVWHKSGHSL